MSAQKLTGYPSIDKPWLKYYTKEAIEMPMPACSIYEYMAQGNRSRPERVALVYMGREITYGELLNGIDRAANAFLRLGVKPGDIVAGITPSFPETLYAFYALNKIGAVSDWFDPRSSLESVGREITATQAKIVLLAEDFAPTLTPALKNLGVETIVSISALDSLPGAGKPKPVPEGVTPWSEFVAGVEDTCDVTAKGDVAHLPAVMEHTGGTTGEPKGIVLTNQNVNAVVTQYVNGGTPLTENDSWLAVAIPYTTYALVFSQHLPLCCGMRCGLCLDFDLEQIEKVILEGRYNHMAHTPIMWERLIHSKRVQESDLSFLIYPRIGADSMAPSKEKEVNAFLEAHGCPYHIMQGYGMSEVASAVTFNISNEYSRIGSIGLPLVSTTISIFDIDTGEELPYGQQGEICMSGPSVMEGYYGNPEATAEVLKLHKDGRVWMHSGDLGHMDEDGFVFIDGRIKRMLIDHHGFKVFAPKIEQVLSRCECVDKCSVIGAPDKEYGVGQVAVAYVILKPGHPNALEEMRALCEKELPENARPADYVIVDQFPYTSAAKVNYRQLEQEYAQSHR